ncbi:anti sigma factor C-terminal domain-containing protein [Oceanobacillus senegalensis]|uniref:anti sigma factor C-terminal domain-containing protein n=1 Tax=Oceanobacillus senegalensis TaxID=1936063 RepID=UPI000A305521|nr:anti sigma factor C-terminal domain-containing protein [Oceanobacillus senegalensis]
MTDHKDSKKEKELNELFNGNLNKPTFKRTVRKAKIMTIIRNIAITLFVVMFLVIVLGFSWLSMMRWNQENAVRDIELFTRISDPNIEALGVQKMGNGLFEGILIFDRYKEIEGIPVNWSDQVVTYSLFGGISRLAGDHTPIQLIDEKDGQKRYYNRDTKQRIMQFYHPEVTYNDVRNDLNRLNNLTDETLVEMALSFDKKYTPEEVRDFIHEDVTLEWYWADTYTNLDGIKEINRGDETIPAFPELASQVYGFNHLPHNPSQSEEVFIEDIKTGFSIEGGKYFGEFQRIYNYIKGKTSTLSADHVDVLGVVVTGTAAELKKLNDSDMIRASVLGVTANPY